MYKIVYPWTGVQTNYFTLHLEKNNLVKIHELYWSRESLKNMGCKIKGVLI
jgi:hypothetical protein